MSEFGYDTFKQDLLDEINYKADQYKMDRLETISEVLEVVSYLARHAFSKDEALEKMKEWAYEEAKRDILAKLNK